MADHESLQSPTNKNFKPTSSFFKSPKLFTVFSLKSLFETDSMMTSPTSILDNKSFWEKLDSKGVGLGMVDSLIDEKIGQNLFKPENNRMVLFGSQLKIQIPSMPGSSFYPIDSPKLPPNSAIKTKISIPSVCSDGLSPAGRCEKQDCNVFSRPPNSRNNHVFEGCVMEKCCGVVGFSISRQEYGFISKPSSKHLSENFLSFCFSCRKKLGYGRDIYMYRGEKAFCSIECRYEEMLLEEKIEKFENYGGY